MPHPSRQHRTLIIACTALVIGAILLIVLPLKLPLPLRLGLASVDLIAAATVWLLARQNSKR